jgi:hypothetical protein
MKNAKAQNQKDYRSYLDQQIVKSNPTRQDQGNQLIMPSYHYPNLPHATYKKAIESIDLVKKNQLFEKQNKYYSSPAQYETIIDYGNFITKIGDKNYYLGDTRLKHNPIVYPLNDGEYNKYLLRLKNNMFYDKTLTNTGNKIVA